VTFFLAQNGLYSHVYLRSLIKRINIYIHIYSLIKLLCLIHLCHKMFGHGKVMERSWTSIGHVYEPWFLYKLYCSVLSDGAIGTLFPSHPPRLTPAGLWRRAQPQPSCRRTWAPCWSGWTNQRASWPSACSPLSRSTSETLWAKSRYQTQFHTAVTMSRVCLFVYTRGSVFASVI